MDSYDVFLLGGVFPGMTPDTTLRRVVDHVRAAEDAGFGGAWVAEHHFIEYGANPSATLLAAHLLAATSRIHVGTAVAMLSNRHPVALGEEAATLDALAPGRFHLGVGRGGPWVDLEVFGTGVDRYERGFTEGLDLLLRWLSGAERVGGTGEFFNFREVDVMPPGRGRPVWVAATSESSARLAGRFGCPLLLGLHAEDDAHAALLDAWAEAAADAGHDPVGAEHASTHLAQVADDAGTVDRLRESLTELLTRGIGQYVSLLPSRSQRDHGAYVDWMIERHAVGPADRVAERLAASADRTGVRRQLLLVEGLGDPEAVGDNIAALGAALNRDTAAGDATGLVPGPSRPAGTTGSRNR